MKIYVPMFDHKKEQKEIVEEIRIMAN